MLDLDGDVVGQPRKFGMQSVHHSHRMPRAVEEIGIAKRNMLRPGSDLLADVGKHDFPLHDPERAVVNGDDRAMPAKMLASAACFGVAGAPARSLQLKRGIGTKRL